MIDPALDHAVWLPFEQQQNLFREICRWPIEPKPLTWISVWAKDHRSTSVILAPVNLLPYNMKKLRKYRKGRREQFLITVINKVNGESETVRHFRPLRKKKNEKKIHKWNT